MPTMEAARQPECRGLSTKFPGVAFNADYIPNRGMSIRKFVDTFGHHCFACSVRKRIDLPAARTDLGFSVLTNVDLWTPVAGYVPAGRTNPSVVFVAGFCGGSGS